MENQLEEEELCHEKKDVKTNGEEELCREKKDAKTNGEEEEPKGKSWAWMVGLDFKIKVNHHCKTGMEINGAPPKHFITKQASKNLWEVYSPTEEEYFGGFRKKAAESYFKDARNALIKALIPTVDEMKSFPRIWGMPSIENLLLGMKDACIEHKKWNCVFPEDVLKSIFSYSTLDYEMYADLLLSDPVTFSPAIMVVLQRLIKKEKHRLTERDRALYSKLTGKGFYPKLYYYQHADNEVVWFLIKNMKTSFDVKLVLANRDIKDLVQFNTLVSYMRKIATKGDSYPCSKFFSMSPLFLFDVLYAFTHHDRK